MSDRDVLFRVGVEAHPQTTSVLEGLGNEILATQERISQSMETVAESAIQQVRRLQAELQAVRAPTGFAPIAVGGGAGSGGGSGGSSGGGWYPGAQAPGTLVAAGPDASAVRGQLGKAVFGGQDPGVEVERKSQAGRRAVQEQALQSQEEANRRAELLNALHLKGVVEAEAMTTEKLEKEFRDRQRLLAQIDKQITDDAKQAQKERDELGKQIGDRREKGESDREKAEAEAERKREREAAEQKRREDQEDLRAGAAILEERKRAQKDNDSLGRQMGAGREKVEAAREKAEADAERRREREEAEQRRRDEQADVRAGAAILEERKKADAKAKQDAADAKKAVADAAREQKQNQEYVDRYQRSQDIKSVQKFETATRKAKSYKRMERVYGQRAKGQFKGALRGAVQIGRGLGLAGLSEKEGEKPSELLQDLMKLQAAVDMLMGAANVFEAIGKGVEFWAMKQEMARKATEASAAVAELAGEHEAAASRLRAAAAAAEAEQLERINRARAGSTGGTPLTPGSIPNPVSGMPAGTPPIATGKAEAERLGADGADLTPEVTDTVPSKPSDAGTLAPAQAPTPVKVELPAATSAKPVEATDTELRQPADAALDIPKAAEALPAVVPRKPAEARPPEVDIAADQVVEPVADIEPRKPADATSLDAGEEVENSRLRTAAYAAEAEELERINRAKAAGIGTGEIPLTAGGDPDLKLPQPPPPPGTPGAAKDLAEVADEMGLEGGVFDDAVPSKPADAGTPIASVIAEEVAGEIDLKGAADIERYGFDPKDLIKEIKDADLAGAVDLQRQGLDAEDLLGEIAKAGVSQLDLDKAASIERKLPGLRDVGEVVTAEIVDQGADSLANKAKGAVEDKVIESTTGALSNAIMAGAGALATKLGATGVGGGLGTLAAAGTGAIAGVGLAAYSALDASKAAGEYGVGGGAEQGTYTDWTATKEVEVAAWIARMTDRIGVKFTDLGEGVDKALYAVGPLKIALDSLGFSFGDLAKEVEGMNRTAKMTERLTETQKNRREEQVRGAAIAEIDSAEQRELRSVRETGFGMQQRVEKLLAPRDQTTDRLQEYDWQSRQEDYERKRAIRFREPGAMSEAAAERASFESRQERVGIQEEGIDTRAAFEMAQLKARQEANQKDIAAAEKRKAEADARQGPEVSSPEQTVARDKQIKELDAKIAAAEGKDQLQGAGRASVAAATLGASELWRWGAQKIGLGAKAKEIGFGGPSDTDTESLEDLRKRRSDLNSYSTAEKTTDATERVKSAEDLVARQKEGIELTAQEAELVRKTAEEKRSMWRESIANAEKEVMLAREAADAAKERRESEQERIGGMHYSKQAELQELAKQYEAAGKQGMKEGDVAEYDYLTQRAKSDPKSMSQELRQRMEELQAKFEANAGQNMSPEKLQALAGLTTDSGVKESLRQQNEASGNRVIGNTVLGNRDALTESQYNANAIAAEEARQAGVAGLKEAGGEEAAGLGKIAQDLAVRLNDPKFNVTITPDPEAMATLMLNGVRAEIANYEQRLTDLINKKFAEQRTGEANKNSPKAGAAAQSG